MKIANPFYYPLAVLTGGIILVGGLRFLALPNLAILPVSAAIATGGATVLKTRQSDNLRLTNPALRRELESVKQQANSLAKKARNLRTEAGKMLTGIGDMELLAMVEYACDRATEVPRKIDHKAARLQGDDALLSIDELQGQLKEVRGKLSRSQGVAKKQLTQLAKSLNRNIQLARQGQDARQAQVVSLSTIIQDSGGVLQQMQNKLRIADLSSCEDKQELQLLTQELRGFQESIDLLVMVSC
jgi:hypothetical protein